MGRMIEVGAGRIPRQLTLAAGDLLRLPVTGGHVISGGHCVQVIGPLVPAIVGLDGDIVMPAALPNVMFVLALAPGTATLSLFVARDLSSSSPIALEVEVVAG